MKTPSSRGLRLGLLASAILAALLNTGQAETFSLAGDFTYTENNADSLWSFRMDDYANNPPTFLPLLTSTASDARTMWGTPFATPPMMWSEGGGYWGIGKNTTGVEQTGSGVTWAPGEVLLHPKAGGSPARLVIAWRAPRSMWVNVHSSFRKAMPCGNGIGYELRTRIGGVDTEIVGFGAGNIGAGITRDHLGLYFGAGDQLFFRIDTWGDAGCDITGAVIEITEVPQPPPEIELSYTDRFTLAWSDVGSGADLDGSFWVPTIPPGQNIFAFGHAGMSGYGQPLRTVVGKALVGSAFAHPVGFTFVWNDGIAGTCIPFVGCFGDRGPTRWIWNPVPPAGYVSLGTVATTGGAPSPGSVVCVRSDLVVQGIVGDLIWSDAGSGSDLDFSAWKIVAPPGGVALGAFIGTQGGAKPTGPVYCLRASAVPTPAVPSQAEIESLIATYGPIIKFHPDELYFPDDPAAILDRPDTRLEWATVQNEGEPSTFAKTVLGGSFTSSTTILDDVQAALAHPQAANADFRYYLTFPQSLPGNLSQAKVYVRVQPVQGVLTELQFWVFCPWNTAGKAHIFGACLENGDIDPTGTYGQHWSDWESIRVRITSKNVWNPGNDSLVSVVMSQHDGDEEVAASDPRLQKRAGRPVVYAARGSHAHYPTAGRFYYKTIVDKDYVVCSAVGKLYDLTGDGLELETYQPNRHTLVSSAWPSVATTTPDWFFFGGNWGPHQVVGVCITITVFGQGVYTQCEYDVEHGKLGLLRRNEWAVARPENANLGSLRTSTGTLNPGFSPNLTTYTLSAASGVLAVTPQAADHNALVEVRVNGGAYAALGSGQLLGKQSNPLSLNSGSNTVNIRVTVPPTPIPGVTPTVKTYTLTVTRTSTIVANTNDNGPGSLRQLIADVPAGATITFAPSLSGTTITLASGQLLLNKNLTIDASALPGGITINGGGASRVFEMAFGTTVALDSLTITGGNAGGAAGGGLETSGVITLNRCTFSGNTAYEGGAVRCAGGGSALNAANCTFSGNTAQIGGAISIADGGPGAVLSHLTIVGNTATGNAGGPFGGGGIFSYNKGATVANCLIGGNASPYGPDIHFVAGAVMTPAGANLIGNNASVTAQFPAGPLAGTAASPLNPRLAALANYGGPTRTMPPLPGSPAIGHAVQLASTPPTDQRNTPRPGVAGATIGSVEAFPFSTLPLVDTDNDGIDDRLETAYGLVVGVNNRTTDSDADGSPDGAELYNMTDPTNPNDSFRIISFAAAEIPGRNLLQDGGFELGLTAGSGTYNYLSTYGAWTTTQGTTAILGMPYAGTPSYEGMEATHVGDSFGAGAVWQSFATTIGQKYRLSLAVIGWGGAAGTVQATVFNASNTNLIADFAAPGGNVWGNNGYEFIATSSLSTLQIQNTSGASTIDDVRVVAVVPGTGGNNPALVAQWVAADWTGGTAHWVDRVGGRIATVAGAGNSPVKTLGIFPARGAAAASGLVFDGVNDYFSVAAAQNPIVGKTSVTIVAFFATTQGASGADGAPWRYPGPLNAESPAWPNDWALTYDAAGNAQGLFNFEITPSPAVSLIDGQPHTMILTWQDPSVFPGGGVARLYVDGILAGSTAEPDGGDGIVNNGFVIGSEPELLQRYFSGAIGELRFYDSIQDPVALHTEITGPQPVVFDMTLRTFPGLGYALESNSTPSTGFQPVPNSAFTATDYTRSLRVFLAPGQAFIRAKRN